MPVYTLACHKPLTQHLAAKIAHSITETHCQITGAPAEFVSVIFMYRQRIKGHKILSLIGNVRSGGNRNLELTDQLKTRMQRNIARDAQLSIEDIAVTLVGFPASWAMEGGEILPEPGQETAWLARTHVNSENNELTES